MTEQRAGLLQHDQARPRAYRARHHMRRLLARMLDEDAFLSPFGMRCRPRNTFTVDRDTDRVNNEARRTATR